MLKKERGFTLIELLIVVAIIGILAALLIPNAITAIQKAKLTSTMKEIKVISTAIADYVTDNGSAPAQDGTYDNSSAFYTALSSFYVKVIPLTDRGAIVTMSIVVLPVMEIMGSLVLVQMIS